MQGCWIKSIRSKDAFISTVITDCEQKNISSIISTSREKHNSFFSNILNPYSTDDAAGVTPTEKMNHKLKSEKEKERYKKRKQTVEPVFGVIKDRARLFI